MVLKNARKTAADFVNVGIWELGQNKIEELGLLGLGFRFGLAG